MRGHVAEMISCRRAAHPVVGHDEAPRRAGALPHRLRSIASARPGRSRYPSFLKFGTAAGSVSSPGSWPGCRVLNYWIFPAVTAFPYSISSVSPAASTSAWSSCPPIHGHGRILEPRPFTALVGGQISIMLGDFFQGILTLLVLTVIFFFIIGKFSWMDISAACNGAFGNP